jgi:hypothetical protein
MSRNPDTRKEERKDSNDFLEGLMASGAGRSDHLLEDAAVCDTTHRKANLG